MGSTVAQDKTFADQATDSSPDVVGLETDAGRAGLEGDNVGGGR